jgi:hypothetical protein
VQSDGIGPLIANAQPNRRVRRNYTDNPVS